MIWHIFKKDLRLWWHMAGAVLALHVLQVGVTANDAVASRVSALLAAVCYLAEALLVVAVVQQDALPGLRQDWLIRPIRRTDLLFSKLLFVVLAIQFPILLADFSRGLAIGLPAGLAWSASFAPNVRMFCILLLPLLAFATMTRNLIETLAGMVVIALGVALFLASVMAGADLNNSSLWWIAGSLGAIFGVIGAGLILALQYYGRKTIPSRFFCAFTILGVLAVQLLPWKPAFAIQQKLSSQPAAADAVQLDLGRAIMVYERGMLANLDIPTNFKGVSADETLRDDRIDSKIVDNGVVMPLGRTTFDGHSLSYDGRFQVVTVPRDILKSRSAQLELDYSLTLFRMTAHEYLPLNARTLVNGIGICTTGTNDLPVVEVNCSLGRAPTLTKWSLNGVSFEVAWMSDSTWLEDYSPWFGRGLTFRRARFPIVIRERDVESERRRAVAELKTARLELRAYEAIAHFKRHLSVPVSQIAPAGISNLR